MKTKNLALLASLGLLCSCASEVQELPLRSVMTVNPEVLGAEKVVTFPGVVEEAKEVNLGFKVAGQLSKICVKEGDYVRQGQTIAMLDDTDYKLGAEALQIQYDQLAAEMERMKQLHEGKSLSDNDYEKATAGLQQLKVQLQTALNKLQYTRLEAPMDGCIQSVGFEQSEMVNAGTPVVTLLSMNGMEVKTDIPSTLYREQKNISKIVCKTAASDAESQTMKLLSIVPKADGTQLYKMRLAFAGTPDKSLTAGMNVDVSISIAAEADGVRAYTLPLHCIFQDGGETYVWAIGTDSLTHKTHVTIKGTADGGRAIVTDGLTGDERIVKAGVGYLHNNEKVKTVGESSETNEGGLL